MGRYSDIELNFIPHPVTGDLQVLNSGTSIKRAIYNVLMYNKLEKPFIDAFGAGISHNLFELPAPSVVNTLKEDIALAINNNEERVIFGDATVTLSQDARGFDIVIEYSIKNEPSALTLNLKI